MSSSSSARLHVSTLPCWDAACWQVSPLGLRALGPALRHLHTLRVAECASLPDSALHALASLPALTALHLAGGHGLTTHGLAAMARLPRLATLGLQWREGALDQRACSLASLPKLTTLHLECFQATDEGLQALARLTGLTTATLCIRWGHNVTDAGMSELARVPALVEMRMSECSLITDAALEHLGRLPALRTLHLEDSEKVTKSGVRGFDSNPKQTPSLLLFPPLRMIPQGESAGVSSEYLYSHILT